MNAVSCDARYTEETTQLSLFEKLCSKIYVLNTINRFYYGV